MPTINQNELMKIANYIKEGNLVAIPTETVYGISIAYNNLNTLKKLKEFKNRDNNPLAIMLSNKNELEQFANVDKLAQKIIDKYLPGELTIVLNKKNNISNEITGGLSTIGIRIPNNQFLNDLIKLTGPLIVTSANKKGEPPCLSSEEVAEKLSDIDVIVEGKCKSNIPTTVAQVINNEVKILRQGNVKINLD